MFSRISRYLFVSSLLVCVATYPGGAMAQQMEEAANPAAAAGPSPIPPKAQRALDKASKLLGPNMMPDEKEWARHHLATAYRLAPTSADVNYLLGVYSWHVNDRAQAMVYWTKAIEFFPKHYRALLSLGQALIDEDRPGEALPYLERAQKAEPFSWRAYALASHAYLREGSPDQAVKHAERALELGHQEAAVAQRYLAAALATLGETEKAIAVLQLYTRSHRADLGAKRQLQELKVPGRSAQGAAQASSDELLQSAAITAVTPLPLPPSRWFPEDVDEGVPPVEPGTPCALDEILQRAGKRIQEFVQNVDRYTASEFLEHESVDKWGFPGTLETRKFNYLATIEEVRPGYFGVLEYRTGLGSLAELPGGIATNGLPALALVFHPKQTENFDIACEGLSRWNDKPAWQVHFRQRPDKPNTMRAYKMGEQGPSYPVALRGRAWIAADSYQIVRMETDLVAPVPEIRLVTDHTAVEYGPVRFRNRNVEMWLPQSAELYSDWKGKRMHRRLSFRDYLLFSVDEKQHISEPKAATESQPES